MIINSLLDTDLYKFTMMQVILHRFAEAEVEYILNCRMPGIDLRPYCEEIQQEITELCLLYFQEDELEYLDQFSFFQKDFIEYLRDFQLNPAHVQLDASGEQLELQVKGPWLQTIMFEVPLLAIISEVYHRNTVAKPDYVEGRKRLAQNIELIRQQENFSDFRFSDFGTRRRFSGEWHEFIVKSYAESLPEYFMGTSDVLFAKRLGIKPIGTMAHEYLQAAQVLGPDVLHSQEFALEVWLQEYGDQLGIALSDVVGFDAFLRAFNEKFCRAYAGVRHDSGDPIAWGERMIQYYQQLGIDPREKTLVFSDGLTMPRALEIYRHFQGQVRIMFGIGTKLSNDLGHKPIQIVIKMVECNAKPVAKISDAADKVICKDVNYLNYLRKVFQIK